MPPDIAPPEPKETNLQNKLESALRTKDAQQIYEALRKAVFALTEIICQPNYLNNLKIEVDSFVYDLSNDVEADADFYLNDSGISRLTIWCKSDGSIFIEPTNNSSKKVKENWEMLK